MTIGVKVREELAPLERKALQLLEMEMLETDPGDGGCVITARYFNGEECKVTITPHGNCG